MPLFEYTCGDCGRVTEFLEKAGSRAQHQCEGCGSKGTSKIFSSFSAQSASPAPPASCDQSCRTTGSCPFAKG